MLISQILLLGAINMSALDNMSFTNPLPQNPNNNNGDELGLNGNLKRSPKFYNKNSSQPKNKNTVPEHQSTIDRSILTMPVTQK